METPITEAEMEQLLQLMDRIHNAAKAGTLESVTDMTPHQVLGWLDDIVYTAQEAMTALKPKK